MASNIETQRTKATLLRDLHHSDRMLILPNIWDVLGASLLEHAGYPAIATASAAIAYSNGYNDGQHIPLEKVLSIFAAIAKAVSVPVTADFEMGYASGLSGLSENIERIIDTGIAGINFEDVDPLNNKLFSVDDQCRRIEQIRTTASKKQVPLLINARTDVYIRMANSTEEEKFDETLKRAKAYAAAGADCIYPITMKKQNDIQELVRSLSVPVNILAMPGIPALKTLQEIGVARLSLGPGFLKMAVQPMKDLAEDLKKLEGLEKITTARITSEFLKELVKF